MKSKHRHCLFILFKFNYEHLVFTKWHSIVIDQTVLSGVQLKSNTSLLQAEVMTMKDLWNEMKDMAETVTHDLDSQIICWIYKAVVMSPTQTMQRYETGPCYYVDKNKNSIIIL